MKIFAQILSIVSALAVAVLCGFSVWEENGVWVAAVAVANVLALPVASLLHECGHMLFGAVCKIKTKLNLSLFGSSCCVLIPKTEKNLRARLYITASGGIFINFAVALSLLLIAALTPAPAWITFLAPSNVYLCILNAVPAELYGGKTDGLALNGLVSDSDEAKVAVAVMQAQARLLSGAPAQDIGELILNLPVIREDDPSFIALCELKSLYFKDIGQDGEAAIWQSRFESLKEEYL